MFLNCSWIFISKIAGHSEDAILTGKVDSRARGQVLKCQMQMKSFNLFFGLQLGILVLRHTDNSSSTLCYTHLNMSYKAQSIAKMIFSSLQDMRGS